VNLVVAILLLSFGAFFAGALFFTVVLHSSAVVGGLLAAVLAVAWLGMHADE
jgi:hypothetical protein